MSQQSERQSQLKRFKKAAREIGADTSDDALDKVMGKLDLKRKGAEVPEIIRPSDAPTDGQRVLFYFPDTKKPEMENMVTGTFDSNTGVWHDTAGTELDISLARAAQVVGHDP